MEGTSSSRTGSFAIAEVVEHLRSLGLERGGVLLAHTSFRAIRPVARLSVDALAWRVRPLDIEPVQLELVQPTRAQI